jgi:hypothetical protein
MIILGLTELLNQLKLLFTLVNLDRNKENREPVVQNQKYIINWYGIA